MVSLIPVTRVKAKAAIVTVLAGAVGYAALQRLGRTYGATAEERRRGLPGDELIVAPMAVTTHATTIAAPPERIWPWLLADGLASRRLVHGRVGRPPPLPRELAERDRHRPGAPAPRGRGPRSGRSARERLRVRRHPTRADRHLVLRSTTHLPPSWTERFGAWLDWTWAFVLDDRAMGGHGSSSQPRPRRATRGSRPLYLLVIVPADFVMSRQMLRGLRSRAEAHEHQAVRRRGG